MLQILARCGECKGHLNVFSVYYAYFPSLFLFNAHCTHVAEYNLIVCIQISNWTNGDTNNYNHIDFVSCEFAVMYWGQNLNLNCAYKLSIGSPSACCCSCGRSTMRRICVRILHILVAEPHILLFCSLFNVYIVNIQNYATKRWNSIRR